jgi:hypothetical protein
LRDLIGRKDNENYIDGETRMQLSQSNPYYHFVVTTGGHSASYTQLYLPESGDDDEAYHGESTKRTCKSTRDFSGRARGRTVGGAAITVKEL